MLSDPDARLRPTSPHRPRTCFGTTTWAPRQTGQVPVPPRSSPNGSVRRVLTLEWQESVRDRDEYKRPRCPRSKRFSDRWPGTTPDWPPGRESRHHRLGHTRRRRWVFHLVELAPGTSVEKVADKATARWSICGRRLCDRLSGPARRPAQCSSCAGRGKVSMRTRRLSPRASSVPWSMCVDQLGTRTSDHCCSTRFWSGHWMTWAPSAVDPPATVSSLPL
jgi:hypothetical protein